MQGRSSKFHSKDHLEVVHWNGHKRSLSSPCSNPKVNALTTDSPNTWSFGRRGKRRTLWKERLILIGREWVLPYIHIQTSFTIYSFSTDRWNWSFLLMCHIVGSATSSLLSWNLLIRWYTNWTKRGRQVRSPSGMNPSSYCYCFGPLVTCMERLLRCGKMKLTMRDFDLVGAVPVFVQCFAGQTKNMHFYIYIIVVQLTSH